MNGTSDNEVECCFIVRLSRGAHSERRIWRKTDRHPSQIGADFIRSVKFAVINDRES